MPFKTPVTFDCTNARPDLLAAFPYLQILRESPTFAALADDLDGWQMLGADLDDIAYQIDMASHTIRLNTRGLASSSILRSQYFRNNLAFAALCAVRAAWAARAESHARSMHRPDTWPLIGRMVRADTAAMAVRMGYELLDIHEGEILWRHTLGDALGDVALEYARAVENLPEGTDDDAALGAAFMAWLGRPERLHVSDAQILAEMDMGLPALAWDGRGKLSEGALRCLSVDPLDGDSYLGHYAGIIAGDPAQADMVDPINQAHFLQIMEEIGTTRVAGISMRDSALAKRLFPGLLEKA